MRDDEKQTPGGQPEAEAKTSDVGKAGRRFFPRITSQDWMAVRDAVVPLLGTVTMILMGLTVLFSLWSYAWSGWGDGGSTGRGKNFWVEPIIILSVQAMILSSLFLRRVLAFMHVTAIVIAIAMIAAFVASRRNAETARLYLGMIIYMLAWCIFYVLALLAKRDKSGRVRRLPNELELLQKLPRGLDQDGVRRRIGEPVAVFRQAQETYWRYGGHGPQEKWVFAIFGPDQRYKRFELDQNPSEAQEIRACSIFNAGGPELDLGMAGGQAAEVRDEEKQTPGNQPEAEIRGRGVGRAGLRADTQLSGELLERARDALGVMLGVVTTVLAGLVSLAIFLNYAWGGWGDGATTGPGRSFYIEASFILLVLALIFASFFLRRKMVFMHLTAIVAAASILAAMIAIIRNLEVAKLCYAAIVYLLAWFGFYLLAWLAGRDKSGRVRRLPNELELLQKLPRGLDQDEVRRRIGEPVAVFRQAQETYWRYGGHGPQEKWVFAIFGPDQRYKRFELDQNPLEAQKIRAFSILNPGGPKLDLEMAGGQVAGVRDDETKLPAICLRLR